MKTTSVYRHIEIGKYKAEIFEVEVGWITPAAKKATGGNKPAVTCDTDMAASAPYTELMATDGENMQDNKSLQITAMVAPMSNRMQQLPGTIVKDRPRPASQQGPAMPKGEATR